jgi:predicted nucleic acid-binding protein
LTTPVVCDASTLVACLIDAGPVGQWATGQIDGCELAAPSLVDFEVANILRRHELAGLISHDQAAQAHADLLDLTIERWGYEALAERSWQLRMNLSIYDACYVSLAELLEAPLVTLDSRMAGAPGTRCMIWTPPSSG